MKSTLVLLSLVALSQGVPMPRALDGKIINGEAVEFGEIPYQVSLQTLGGTHICGGSILNKNYVLTAAHCVIGRHPTAIKIFKLSRSVCNSLSNSLNLCEMNLLRKNHLKVIAGTIHLDEPKSSHHVVGVYVHEHYNESNSWINDIALLKIAEEFEVSETVSFVPLPEPNQHVPVDTVAVVSGWGDIKFGGPSPKNLLRAEIYISDQTYCFDAYASLGFAIYDSHICANEPTVVTGACHGDSGGPLTVDGKIVGIVSWFHACAQLKYPTVYTRVAEFIDWIESHAV